MIEQNQLQRRQDALRVAIEAEIDEATGRRFFSGASNQTGVYVDDEMRVTHVVPGSPGHEAGLQPGDRVLEINDTIGGDEPDAVPRLFWAFKRMDPGDIASVTFERAGERRFAQVPVISQRDLERLARDDSNEVLSEAQAREQQRTAWIAHRQRSGLREALRRSRLGIWDGLLLANLPTGLSGRFDAEVGVLVLDSGDPDHPIQAGDILIRVGHNTPADAQHAVGLLYDYHNQPLIPLQVERSGTWLELELPYPTAEQLE